MGQTVRLSIEEPNGPVPSGIGLVSWDVDGTLFSYLRLSGALFRLIALRGMSAGWKNAARQVHEMWEFHRTVERQRRGSNSVVIASELAPFAQSKRSNALANCTGGTRWL